MLWTRLIREEGQAVVEYGLIAVLVSIVAVVVISEIGLKVSGMLGRLVGAFP